MKDVEFRIFIINLLFRGSRLSYKPMLFLISRVPLRQEVSTYIHYNGPAAARCRNALFSDLYDAGNPAARRGQARGAIPPAAASTRRTELRTGDSNLIVIHQGGRRKSCVHLFPTRPLPGGGDFI